MPANTGTGLVLGDERMLQGGGLNPGEMSSALAHPQ
jgi:hypothetical protein